MARGRIISSDLRCQRVGSHAACSVKMCKVLDLLFFPTLCCDKWSGAGWNVWLMACAPACCGGWGCVTCVSYWLLTLSPAKETLCVRVCARSCCAIVSNGSNRADVAHQVQFVRLFAFWFFEGGVSRTGEISELWPLMRMALCVRCALSFGY